jgi:hypothetical protein
VTRSEWQDEKEALEEKLEPYTLENEAGERYISPHPAVARLARAYDRLFRYGLERGWLGGEAVAA